MASGCRRQINITEIIKETNSCENNFCNAMNLVQKFTLQKLVPRCMWRPVIFLNSRVGFLIFLDRMLPLETSERRRKFITKIHANLIFQACISFLRCFGKGDFIGNAGNFLSCLQARISFLRCFRLKWALLFLPGSHKKTVTLPLLNWNTFLSTALFAFSLSSGSITLAESITELLT